MKHKNLKTIVIISLNVLFCILVIWFFTQNSILRPYAGSFLKEAISAMLLLGSLYANCNSADIIAGTKYSLSTVERCLSELRKQGAHRAHRQQEVRRVPQGPLSSSRS